MVEPKQATTFFVLSNDNNQLFTQPMDDYFVVEKALCQKWDSSIKFSSVAHNTASLTKELELSASPKSPVHINRREKTSKKRKLGNIKDFR